ncbi:hypothetical protein F5880DRAFT_1619518 [Lentinula raphanica]|nr:hypothetical protein F5880DRAFT_1619518 [Lentinula raphanica]
MGYYTGPARPGITIIFTPDRGSALRITLYLRRCNPYLAECGRIRKWDSLNDSTYDQESLQMICAMDPSILHACTGANRLIIVSTTILMVGVDFRGMEGRMRGKGECYVYFSKHTIDEAKKRIGEESKVAGAEDTGCENSAPAVPIQKRQKKSDDDGKKKLRMSLQWAKRINGCCRTLIQNETYNNPPFGQHPCSCRDCSANPPPSTLICQLKL